MKHARKYYLHPEGGKVKEKPYIISWTPINLKNLRKCKYGQNKNQKTKKQKSVP